jgi:RecB family exonuclease
MAPLHPVLQSSADWADAVAALPASGALPVRTVVVPTERHAHALRRALLRSWRGAVLAGTRFVGPSTLAREILAAAGRELWPGEEALRAARLVPILADGPELEHFDLDLLRGTPGWTDAFAAAIGDLEGVGLTPDTLPRTAPPWRDLALLWRLLDEAAGSSATASRIYVEATALLAGGAHPPLLLGPTLAAVSGHEAAAQIRFLRALPGVTIGLFAARPVRERHLDRVATLLGPAARDALAGAPLPSAGKSERDLLVRFLFASPELLADPRRPRSAGPDGTVELTEHAGVEAEVEAAAEWVAREVLERGTPLEEIAVLLPVGDPFASMVASRLGRLPWKGGAPPVHVAGGLPLADTAGGARALALLRALSSYLPAEALASLLPAIRIPLDGREHLGHAEASSLAWSLGTVGGNAAHREGALSWSEGAAAREAQLERLVDDLEADPVAEEREGWHLRPLLAQVRAARPALDALVALARLVVEDEPLSAVAPAVVAFLETWVLDPGSGAPVHALLADALEGARTDALGASVRGAAAVELIRDRLLDLRLPTCRFGEPAVYVGTLAGATGLDFQAVRVLGLGEGALPSAGREDPVLPERMRREADPFLLPLSEDRALRQLHAFDRALRGAGRSIALSAPRSDLERSEREASSLLVDAGAALGRLDPAGKGAIPSLASLARTSFGPARASAQAFREAHPLSEVQWQDRAARLGEIHPSWRGDGHLDLDRIRALRSPVGLGPVDGVLGGEGPFPSIPGIDPGRAISASALEKLLRCPLLFLYERILHWEDAGGARSLRELDALTYGSLFHEVMERFYREHGEAFVARKQGLAHWKKLAREIADDSLSSRLASYPLVGAGIREKERRRLLQDVESFLDYDRALPLTRFVGVERPFGSPDPVALDAGGIPFHVRGYVDRIDEEGDHALLRDLKTGRPHPRTGEEAGPTPVRDVQIGLYGLVARKLAARWDIPRKLEVAYAYARDGGERAFRGDYGGLEKAAKEWLALSARLLSERSFPPTPDPDDCGYCAFRPVCGKEVPGRSEAFRADAEGAVAGFLALKGGDE